MSLLTFTRAWIQQSSAGPSSPLADADPDACTLVQGYLGTSVLIFGRNGRPLAVLKCMQDARYNSYLELGTAAERLAADHLPTPSIIDEGTYAGRRFVAHTWIDGKPARDVHTGATVPLSDETAGELLARMPRAAIGSPAVPDHLLQRIAWWRSLLCDRSGGGIAEVFFDKLSARLSALPLVVMHGDFSPVNVLAAAGRALPIDWELGLPVGLPLVDFVTWKLNSAAPGSSRNQTFAQMFTGAAPGLPSVLKFAASQSLDEPTARLLVAITHLKIVAEDRHGRALKDGPVLLGAADDELQCLRTFPC